MAIQLQIRKKDQNVWDHVRIDAGESTFISDFTAIWDDDNMEVVERTGNKVFSYPLSEIVVYDDTVAGPAENFGTILALIQRLKVLGYTAFGSAVEVLAADLISSDPGNALTQGGDGLLFVPVSGGGGDVTAAAVITEDAVVVGDDGVKGVKESVVFIDPNGNITGGRALQLITDAAGVTGIRSINLNYVTGTIPATDGTEGVIVVNIDDTASLGGIIAAYHALVTKIGLADIHGLLVGVNVSPVLQFSGTFADADSILVLAVDQTTALSSGGAGNISVFVANADTITTGSALKYGEIEIVVDTAASNPGAKTIFEYSTGVGTWDVFTPIDGTNGLRNTGLVIWDEDDIPGWLVGTGAEFLIRMTRNQVTLSTTPILDLIQISAVNKFSWNSLGDILANSFEGLVIDRAKKDTNVSGTFNLDYDLFEVWNLVLTGATTFAELNLPAADKSKTILIQVEGNFALTFPANWADNITGAYDGLVFNTIAVNYFGSTEYKVTITQPS